MEHLVLGLVIVFVLCDSYSTAYVHGASDLYNSRKIDADEGIDTRIDDVSGIDRKHTIDIDENDDDTEIELLNRLRNSKTRTLHRRFSNWGRPQGWWSGCPWCGGGKVIPDDDTPDDPDNTDQP